jgi:cytochrome d ubiquinol oxidase subunit I
MSTTAVTVDLYRVLFGFAAQVHYLFVPLSIGLAVLVALLDTMAWRLRCRGCDEAARFWGRFFLLAFAAGIVTGWPLRYLLLQHWAGFASLAAPVMEQVFGIESRIAGLLFTLVLAFAVRMRFPPSLRAAVSASVALVLVAQSLAILGLNAWMQLPLGGRLDDGQYMLDSAWILFENPLWLSKVIHTLSGAAVMGGMLALAISAWMLLHGRQVRAAAATWRPAAWLALVALVASALAGHQSGDLLREHQPAKFAAIEAVWRPVEQPAPLILLAWPDPVSRTNRYAIEIPALLGHLVGGKTIRSLQELEAAGPEPVATPPVAPVFFAFRVMLGAWALMVVIAMRVVWRLPDVRRPAERRALWLCVLSLPLPWVATIAGWMVCEVGRQPWVVTGLLRTRHAIGLAPAMEGALLLVAWGVACAVLLAAHVVLWARWIRQAPVDTPARPPTVGPVPARACLGGGGVMF